MSAENAERYAELSQCLIRQARYELEKKATGYQRRIKPPAR